MINRFINNYFDFVLSWFYLPLPTPTLLAFQGMFADKLVIILFIYSYLYFSIYMYVVVIRF